MPRAHFNRPIVDSAGNIVPNTRVAVYEAGGSTPIAQALYTQLVGSPVWDNPRTTSDGFVDFYLDRPQSVRIGLAVQSATETFVDDIPVLPAPDSLVQADKPFQVLGGLTLGYYLQAGQPGQAAWVDAGNLVNSKPSPLNTIYSYDFSGGQIQDIVITNASGTVVTPTFPDVTADVKPVGWNFTAAIQVPTTSRIKLTIPPLSWSESGAVIFLYKIVSTAAGVGAAILHVSVDDDIFFVETPTVADLCNVWMIGYLDKVPTGTHKVVIEHRPGTDLDSYVLIGPIRLQYGNNIPAHDHPGTAGQTTQVGPGSMAAYVGGTAVGSTAIAGGVNATAVGSDTQSDAGSVGVGAQVRAGPDTVTIGYRANTVGRIGAVSIGKDSAASADAAIALGPTALAQGPSCIAVGSGARTGTQADSVAIGSNAQALAYRAVALGQGAQVIAGHDYSIAIGNGVTTTADHQARIGDNLTTVIIPGNFRQIGGDTLFGGTGKKIGFYGSAGVVKPTVTGSRAGNVTLQSLLGVLAGLGLITDGSVN